jgi:CRP-like cAMP-binding protein
MESQVSDPAKRRASDDGRDLVGDNLLDSLSEKDRSRLFAAGRVRVVEAGEEVVRQGSRGDCLFVLIEGELAVVRCLPGDEEKLLATAKPGMVLGEVAVLDRGARTASLRATRRSVLREIGLGAFEAVTLHGEDSGYRILLAVAASVHERLTRLRRGEDRRPASPAASLPAGTVLEWSTPVSEAVAVLGLLPAFDGLGARDWKEMTSRISVARVDRGMDLELPDASRPDGILIVLRGSLSPWLDNALGPEVTMPTAGPGGFVDYAAALGLAAEPRRWRARSPTELLRLDSALFAPDSEFAARLLYALSRSLATTLRRSTGLSMHFRMAWTRSRAAFSPSVALS